MFLSRLVSALSVRTRIAALALIPILGFGACAATHSASEREVAKAFEGVKRSAALADAREFKAALATMRTSAGDFASRPSPQLATEFLAAHEVASDRLSTIEQMIDTASRAEVATFRTTPHRMRGRGRTP